MSAAEAIPPQAASATPVLRVEGICAGYGAFDVLKDVSVEVRDGEFLGVIGHNGAGKSTLLKVMAGFLSPSAGRVVKEPSLRIGLVPQGLAVFPRMSVADNLRVPEIARGRGRELVPTEQVLEMFPVLEERLAQAAGNLSGGEQRMLAIGMALRLAPQLLLLDEPSLGLAPLLVRRIMEAVDEARLRLGYCVVVVEQNLEVLLKRADRLVAVRQGALAWEGAPQAITDTRVLWEHF